MLTEKQVKSLKDNEGIYPDGKKYVTTFEQRQKSGKTQKHLIPLSKEEQISNRSRQLASKRLKSDKNKAKKKALLYGSMSKKHGVSIPVVSLDQFMEQKHEQFIRNKLK